MIVLGIETTCDETAAAILKEGKEILSDVVSSQVDIHEAFGGVFPELASRRHVELLLPVIDEAFRLAGCSPQDLDCIAVATQPGLMGSLLVGLSGVKALAFAYNLPFVPVNHIEAHLYAALLSEREPINFPAIGVVLSGGHTALYEIHPPFTCTRLSSTVDDAIGEAFDKAARVLSLPYPGGPHIEALAAKGNRGTFTFKPAQVKSNPLAFSYSGLKTEVLYAAKKNEPLSLQTKADIALAFQEAAFGQVIARLKTLLKHAAYETILFGGGVSCNETFRQSLTSAFPRHRLLFPVKEHCTDNATMIASLGTLRFQENPLSAPFLFVQRQANF